MLLFDLVWFVDVKGDITDKCSAGALFVEVELDSQGVAERCYRRRSDSAAVSRYLRS